MAGNAPLQDALAGAFAPLVSAAFRQIDSDCAGTNCVGAPCVARLPDFALLMASSLPSVDAAYPASASPMVIAPESFNAETERVLPLGLIATQASSSAHLQMMIRSPSEPQRLGDLAGVGNATPDTIDSKQSLLSAPASLNTENTKSSSAVRKVISAEASIRFRVKTGLLKEGSRVTSADGTDGVTALPILNSIGPAPIAVVPELLCGRAGQLDQIAAAALQSHNSDQLKTQLVAMPSSHAASEIRVKKALNLPAEIMPTIAETASNDGTSTAPSSGEIEAAAAMLTPLWQLLSRFEPSPASPQPSALSKSDGMGTATISDISAPCVTLVRNGHPLLSFEMPLELVTSNPAYTGEGAESPGPYRLPLFQALPEFTQKVIQTLDASSGCQSVQPPSSVRSPSPVQIQAALPVISQPLALPDSLNTHMAQPEKAEHADQAMLRIIERGPFIAEVTLTDGSVLRIGSDLPAQMTAARPQTGSLTSASLSQKEKNAAPHAPAQIVLESDASNSEKNFLSLGVKSDEWGDAKAGTGLADATSIMPSHSASPNPQVAQAVQALPVSARADQSAGAIPDVHEFRPSLVAHRAVAAVIEVVDLQVASRLQPAPSVQLRMTLGGENLSIKVDVQAGTVQTQFRTDSADLRSAIVHEWSVVRAESSGKTLHYLEPEFAPSGSGTNLGGSGGFAQQGQNAQQQARQAQAEIFGAVGRAYPFGQAETTTQAPELSPIVLPTSQHLSAVA